MFAKPAGMMNVDVDETDRKKIHGGRGGKPLRGIFGVPEDDVFIFAIVVPTSRSSPFKKLLLIRHCVSII